MNPDTTDANKHREHSQFYLLSQRRFAPFFWTQFFGAFNDNVYKNVLILIIAYQTIAGQNGNSDVLINLSAGLFILPFFLFSAMAGQIADKYEKSLLIRRVKIMEIVIMTIAAAALIFKSTYMLMVLLFLMGTQSAFFGPAKYSIIPQHLRSSELIGGNALVEMGTFISIILGTITGGLLVQLKYGNFYSAVFVVCVAVTGWMFSRYIPVAMAPSPDLKIDWNPLTQTFRTVNYALKDKSVFISVIGISWFWFLGASYLTQIPNYTKNILHGSESVVTLLLTMFSIGIGAGSLLCEKLSGKKIEYGLVPLGIIGLTLFGLDLSIAYNSPDTGTLTGIAGFLKISGSIRVLIDIVMIGIFGGLYIVPLYALVQIKSHEEYRSRVIAANNILNALFMVCSAICGMTVIGVLGFSIPIFFGVIAGLNVLFAAIIFSRVPFFVSRFVSWIFTSFVYRVTINNINNIPREEPVTMIFNRGAFSDVLAVSGIFSRNVHLVVDQNIMNNKYIRAVLNSENTLQYSPDWSNKDLNESTLNQITSLLENGELVCVFPSTSMPEKTNVHDFQMHLQKIVTSTPSVFITGVISEKNRDYEFAVEKSFSVKLRKIISGKIIDVGTPIESEFISHKYLERLFTDLLKGKNIVEKNPAYKRYEYDEEIEL